MSCWSCQAGVPRAEPFCPGCGKIQPPDPTMDCFELLGLPRQYGVEPAELERRFRELSRRVHPDRFARAGARERRWSLERSTRLNDACRLLRDPRRRAEYLLRLDGRAPAPEAAGAADPEVLEEHLALREALERARAAGDRASCRRIGEEARGRLARLGEEIAALFREQDGGRDRAAEIAGRLARARYDDRVAAEAEAALDAAGIGP